ncbi:MAG: transcription initiation factor IIB [Chaenotheca gracillima]|nr:MAG: transcription initiation factor IIB [Chaenotheca gracillima]
MLSRTLRASCTTAARVQRQQNMTSIRTFITPTAARQADLVQDMYLSELKKYKPIPVKASDAEGHVQKFTAPKPPQSPEESNIASELQDYENQKVEVEGQESTGDAPAQLEDWFEEPVEEEEGHGGH